MRVYFDLCAIQRPFDDQSQLRVRLEAEAMRVLLALCEEGRLTLLASRFHDIENLKSPYPDRQAHVREVLAVGFGRLKPIVPMLRRAEGFEQAGIKRFDALHLASAVEAGAEYFCTTDDRLVRKGKRVDTDGTSVVTPLELVALLP